VGVNDHPVGPHMRARSPRLRVVLAVTALAASAVALDACSSSGGRSVSAYCQTFYEQGTQFRNEYIKADANMSQDPLAGLAAVITAPTQLAVFFGRLDAVAQRYRARCRPAPISISERSQQHGPRHHRPARWPGEWRRRGD
jgi:hypothetical protein